jgi:hypothetical protein
MSRRGATFEFDEEFAEDFAAKQADAERIVEEEEPGCAGGGEGRRIVEIVEAVGHRGAVRGGECVDWWGMDTAIWRR